MSAITLYPTLGAVQVLHHLFTRPAAAGGSGLYSELSVSESVSQSVPRENYMIEWSDQKVHEQKVAIFFYCDAKKVKKMSKDGFPTVLQISQDVVC